MRMLMMLGFVVLILCVVGVATMDATFIYVGIGVWFVGLFLILCKWGKEGW